MNREKVSWGTTENDAKYIHDLKDDSHNLIFIKTPKPTFFRNPTCLTLAVTTTNSTADFSAKVTTKIRPWTVNSASTTDRTTQKSSTYMVSPGLTNEPSGKNSYRRYLFKWWGSILCRTGWWLLCIVTRCKTLGPSLNTGIKSQYVAVINRCRSGSRMHRVAEDPVEWQVDKITVYCHLNSGKENRLSQNLVRMKGMTQQGIVSWEQWVE